MRPYNTDTGNPISSDESSAGRSPPIPSLVLDKYKICQSDGTRSTWMIETSPLSVADEDNFQPEAISSRRVEDNNLNINGCHNNDDMAQTNICEINQISLQQIERSRTKHHGSRNRRKKEYNNTLTWRMDPSISLSDFTLTIIAVNDEDAITNICREKEKQRNTSRREKWIVEGLYLDMSQSNESVNDCYDSKINNLNRHDDQDMNNTRMNSTRNSMGMVVEKYHLHKVNLAIGKRGCGYFARLFRRKNDDGNSITMHRMEVPISCLPAIPAMLDYLYNPNPDAEVHATTATAIHLRFLGSFLRNPALFDSATRFLQNDLRPETAVEYLKHAELYTQKKLIGICIRILAENFDQLKVTWYASLPPHLMKRVLYSKYFTRSTSSMSICVKIASYCRCQSIDRAMLLSLTDVKIMPVVCPEEALFFIQLLSRFGMDLTNNCHDDHISLKEKSLYERCITAAPSVVQNIIDTSCQDRTSGWPIRTSKWKNTCTDYSQLPPQIKVELLEYTLAQRNHTT
jgi:hypothetical protein